MLKNKHFQLSTLNSQIVRSNPELMAFYITTFEKTFGYKPDCVGCSFTSDFQKLKNRLQTQKTTEIMENTTKKQPTFILRQKKGEILTYRKDDYTFRCYDYNLTEEFVINFLTYGTVEEIKERKKMFSKIPKAPPNLPKGRNKKPLLRRGWGGFWEDRTSVRY